MSSLQDRLTSVTAHLDPDVPYEIKLRSGGFRTPYAIKEADSAKEIADACLGMLISFGRQRVVA